MRTKKSGHVPLRKRLLDLLEKAKDNEVAMTELGKHVGGLKRRKTDIGKYYYSQFYKELRKLEEEGKINITSKRRKPTEFYFDTTISLIKDQRYANNKTIEDIILRFKESTSIHKLILMDKLLNISGSKLIIHSNIINFLKENIETDNIELKNFAMKILNGVIKFNSYVQHSGLTKQIKNLTADKNFKVLLTKIILDDNEKDTSRYHASEILVNFSSQEACDTLIKVLIDRKIFVHEGAFVTLFVQLFKNASDNVKNKIYEECEKVSTRGQDKQREDIAKKILANVGL